MLLQHPVIQADLVNQELELKLYGPAGKQNASQRSWRWRAFGRGLDRGVRQAGAKVGRRVDGLGQPGWW
jgi:hypothetical protein